MGELVFIGMGLHNEQGLSLRGIEEAKSCDLLFAELYTNVMPGLNIQNLAKITGREVRILSRKEVEERAEDVILSKARQGKVGFLVPGDPMVATTHVDLRLRAHRTGIATRIVHAASVQGAVAGVTGLQSYKFGRTATVPVSWQGDFPESVYSSIKNNLALGLHSLVLLEIDMEGRKHIPVPQALTQLLSFAEAKGENVIGARALAVVVARLESPDMIVKAGTIIELSRFDFGAPPYAFVIPGRLHFLEAEALQAFCGAPAELVRSNP